MKANLADDNRPKIYIWIEGGIVQEIRCYGIKESPEVILLDRDNAKCDEKEMEEQEAHLNSSSYKLAKVIL